ncbi:MAG: metal ABC transporter permease [Arachnia sp.]
MIELFSLPFMQRALIAALLSGLVAPAIGMYIVQRKLSLLGDGLGHVAIMGVGLAFLTGTSPLPTAVVTCVVGAVVVELLRQRGKTSGDLGLAILFYGGIASGVMMAGIAGQGAAGLSGYLFGSLTSVSGADLWAIGILGVVILILTIGLGPRLFAVAVDEDYARVLGIRVKVLNLLIVVLAAVTVTISMRTVGLLLISALMVIPVATSQQLFIGFKGAFFGAMGVGVLAALLGTVGSFYIDSATGATIVVASIGLLAVSWLIAGPLRRRRNFIPYVEDHPHGAQEHERAENHDDAHAHEAGVKVIQHGDHVDYVHDGHRHAVHGDHYDEH